MKKVKYLILLIAVATTLSSCFARHHGRDRDRGHDTNRGRY